MELFHEDWVRDTPWDLHAPKVEGYHLWDGTYHEVKKD